MRLRIDRAGPLATIQDDGRFGMLSHGVSASGPMDRGAFEQCGLALGRAGAAVEFTRAGIGFLVQSGEFRAALGGGAFQLLHNGRPCRWPAVLELSPGDRLDITPGASGNYGYLRFDAEIDVPVVLGSRSTSSIAGIGGLGGRALIAGDSLSLRPLPSEPVAITRGTSPQEDGPIRVLWGVHADLFSSTIRQRFLHSDFLISTSLDRMGVRLLDPDGVMGSASQLSLVSEAIVPGDIQVLGDGTPIVLMRDHQPTGGYPRVATIITEDLDRFAQLRPGEHVRFTPVTLSTVQGPHG